jgi:hypothetical protein
MGISEAKMQITFPSAVKDRIHAALRKSVEVHFLSASKIWPQPAARRFPIPERGSRKEYLLEIHRLLW